jgi:uncharacterized protein
LPGLSLAVIIDAYNTVWKAGGTSDYLTSEDYTAEMMLEAMDAAGIDKAMVSSLGQLTDNDYIESCQERHPDRFIAFCQVDPRPREAASQLETLAANPAFSGVKLHPTMHGYHFADHGLLDPIFQACASAQLIVLVNALDDPFCAPLAIEEIASGFPQVPVVIAHMGSVWNVTEAILVASRRPNIFLETSAAELQAVQDAYRHVGPEQILMGTDWPGSDFELERMKIAKAIPDEATTAFVDPHEPSQSSCRGTARCPQSRLAVRQRRSPEHGVPVGRSLRRRAGTLPRHPICGGRAKPPVTTQLAHRATDARVRARNRVGMSASPDCAYRPSS